MCTSSLPSLADGRLLTLEWPRSSVDHHHRHPEVYVKTMTFPVSVRRVTVSLELFMSVSFPTEMAFHTVKWTIMLNLE